MSARGNENASTPPRSDEGFEIVEFDMDMGDLEAELDAGFASLEAELDALDMEEELAEVETMLDSEETRAAFAALEEEMETAYKEIEPELQRLDMDMEEPFFMDSRNST